MRTICDANRGLQILAKQWTVHLIKRLEQGAARHKDLLASALISNKVLSSRLKELLDAGLIEKSDLNYQLTKKGRQIVKVLKDFETVFA